MAIVNYKNQFPPRSCGYSRCGEIFTPKVETQIYCRASHGVLACQERKFKAAVKAAVASELDRMIKAGEIELIKIPPLRASQQVAESG